MIESKNDASKNLEKALQALQQAKQRVANEKKKQNEKKRKAENPYSCPSPIFMVPYPQISMNEQVAAISAHEAKEGWKNLMDRNSSIDENMIHVITIPYSLNMSGCVRQYRNRICSTIIYLRG